MVVWMPCQDIAPPCGFGQDPFGRRHASALRDEPFLQALQVELDMAMDELAVCGRQEEMNLIRRHLLIAKNLLGPRDRPRRSPAFAIERVVREVVNRSSGCLHHAAASHTFWRVLHDVQSRPSRESWPPSQAATSSRINRANTSQTAILQTPSPEGRSPAITLGTRMVTMASPADPRPRGRRSATCRFLR